MSSILVRNSDNLVLAFGDTVTPKEGCTVIETPLFAELVAEQWTWADNRFSLIPELQAIKDAKKAANAVILDQIQSLEGETTDRRLREALLGTDNGWLANMNSQIAALRTQLQ